MALPGQVKAKSATKKRKAPEPAAEEAAKETKQPCEEKSGHTENGLDDVGGDADMLINIGAKPAPPKAFRRADVPESPPATTGDLLQSQARVGANEMYSKDEKLLNEFLRLHPMLSAEATSARTLQLLAGMAEKTAIQTVELPVCTKSHDDALLRPANEVIGERPCINGERCLGQFIAKMRFGPDTPLAFTCTEFLLPAERTQFLNGKGLPKTRKKCLMCSRYFSNYVYLLARNDPTFRAGVSSLGLQMFCNPVVPNATAPYMNADEDVDRDAASVPEFCNPVSSEDGYRPEAMLFVDESFANTHAARETNMKMLTWRPIVKFCSRHYKYEKDEDGPRIIQVGVGVDTKIQDFGQPLP